MSDMNRRQFVILATAAIAGCAACSAEAAPATQSSGPVDVGTKADFAKDGVFDKWAKDEKIFIVRNEGKLYATTATCTHRKANLKLKDGGIFCPNHGSKFSNFGTPTKGPAKISLMRYGISVDADGKIKVDKSKSFEEKQWDDEGASIKV